jgi:hypothetical protein
MATLNMIKKEASGAPTSDAGELFPKWKMALALGVPVAAVLGLGWYWYRTEQPVPVKRVADNASVGKKRSTTAGVPDSPKVCSLPYNSEMVFLFCFFLYTNVTIVSAYLVARR